MDGVGVVDRVRVVDFLAVRVAPKGVVVGREDARHAGGRRHGMNDGAVPIGLAHRVEWRERVFLVHGGSHGTGLISIYRSDLVLLLYQAGRWVVKR